MKKAICLFFITLFIQSQEDFDLSLIKNFDSIPDEIKEQLIAEESVRNDSIEIQDNLAKDIKFEEKEIMESGKFGYSFFNTKSQTKTPILDIPLQSDYVLSFNDELELLLVGNESRLIDLRIDLSGNVLLPEIGRVSLLNLTISEANKKISTLISDAYLGTESYLNVKNPSLRKISIIGSVNEPGTYLVNPFISLTEAIKYASGFSDNASLRTIEVIGTNGDIKVYDLYDFLIFGDRTSDANLKNGDTIKVKSTSKFVTISGSVHRPMIYEYKIDDTYKDLLEFSLGINGEGNTSSVSSIKRESTRTYTSKVNQKDTVGNLDLIEVFVGKNITINDKDIFITGAGVTSGYYTLPADGSLRQLLDEIKFSSDIYPFYAVYEQELNNGLSRQTTAFSLADPDTYKSLKATKNSKIFFYDRDYIIADAEKYDEENPALISDYAQIFLPEYQISIPVVGKLSPKQIHLYLGGKEDIDEENVAVISTELSNSNSYELVFDSSDLVAISFPPIKQNLIEVEIVGEIRNPGIFRVPSSTTLSELYTLAGGFLPNAFQNGIGLYRDEVKQKEQKALKEAKAILSDSLIQKSASLSDRGSFDIRTILELAEFLEPTGRVSGNFSKDSIITKNLILKDGDLINIPAFSNEVTVQGEVLNSSSFIYVDGMSFNDYIKASGGYTSFADKRSGFIIRANGEAIPASINVFGGKTDIYPGDTIVVPRDLNQLEGLPLVSVATKIISDIAFSAASLNVLKN